MPKFYGQNKKRIDPRYFLNETANRDLSEVMSYDGSGHPEGEVYTSPDRDLSDMDISSTTPEEASLLSTLKKEMDANESAQAYVRRLHDSWFDEDLDRNHAYSQLMRRGWERSDVGEELEKVIRPADTDGDGTRDSDELRAIAKNMEDESQPPRHPK